MPPVAEHHGQEPETVLVPIADVRLLVEFVSFPDKRREIDDLKALIDARDRVATALEGNRG
jgi:hypothetical protein